MPYRAATVPFGSRHSLHSFPASLWRLVATLLVVLLVAAACSGSGDDDRSAGPADGAGEEGSDQGDGNATDTAAEGVVNPTVGPPPTPYPDDAILVGIVMADSFLLRDLDRQAAIAARASFERINASGGLDGRPLVPLFADTQSRLSLADEAARRMIDQGASLLLVTCDAEYAAPALAHAIEADVMVLSPCGADPRWASGELGNAVFSVVTPAEVDGRSMANVAWENGWRGAALVGDSSGPDAAGQCLGFKERWQELGGGFSEAKLALGTIDGAMRNPEYLDSLRTDVIVLCATPSFGVQIVSAIRDAEVPTMILAGPTMDAGWRPSDIEAGLGNYTIVAYATINGDDPSVSVADAIEDFRALDGAVPQSGRFVGGADAVSVFVQVAQQSASLSGADLSRALRSMGSVQVASGTLSFGDGSHAPVNRSLRVLVHDGSALVFDRLTQ